MITLAQMGDIEGSSYAVTQLIIILVLTLINAFLAASELSILSASSFKIDSLAENNNKKAKLVQKLRADETNFLSTIQVGITLAGFFSSATAAVSLSSGLANILTSWNLMFASEISLILVTLILAYFTLVFGELLPKRIALRNPEAIAMAFAGPVNIIRIIFKPVVFILSGSCELLFKLFKLNSNKEEVVTEDEIKALVSSSVEDGVVSKEEQDLINSVFTFGDLVVSEVMTHRINICMINIDDDIELIKKIIREEKYTRIPVYKNNKDNIIGILNVKDIIISLNSSFNNEQLETILRRPVFVNETMKIDNLLKQMKVLKTQSAVVIDEVGSVSGYVTMEDLIEEIIGNVDDEHDETNDTIKKIDNNTYLVDGTIPLRDLSRYLSIDIKKDSNYYSTLAGFINYKKEGLPKINDELILEHQNIKIKITQVENNRIKEVEITKINIT